MFLGRTSKRFGLPKSCVGGCHSATPLHPTPDSTPPTQQLFELTQRVTFQVVYTKGPHLQIKVHAEVVHPKSGHHDTTNIFHFTFTTYENVDVQSVMPKTYAGKMISIFALQLLTARSSHQVLCGNFNWAPNSHSTTATLDISHHPTWH